MENDVKFLINFLASGTRVLSSRLLLILTLLMTFGLFIWCMIQPDYWRLGAATIFALMVFLPIRSIDSKEKHNDTQNG